MRTVLMSCCLLLLASPSSARSLTPEKLFKQASPSIVKIVVPISKKETRSGSGVVIKHLALGQVIATNCHVVDVKTDNIFAQGSDDKPIKMILVGGDRDKDLCILRAAIPGSLLAPPVSIASSSTLSIGERVYAIGSPKGFSLTFSDGMVSGFRNVGGFKLIQTTTPISSGSSGGGLFNESGKLVGITTLVLKDSQAMNFAVPADQLPSLPLLTTSGTPQMSYVPTRDRKWEEVFSEAGDTISIDLNSIRYSARDAMLWIRMTRDNSKYYNSNKAQASELWLRQTYYCGRSTWSLNEVIAFDFSKKQLGSSPFPSEYSSSNQIKKNSFESVVYGAVCKDR